MTSPEFVQPAKSVRPAVITRVWWLVVLLLLGAGISLLIASLLTYGQIKPAADHLARDGSLEIFTPALHAQLRPAWLISAVLLMAAGLFWIIFRSQSIAYISRCLNWFSAYSLLSDFQALARTVFSTGGPRIFLWGIAAVLLGSLLLRALYLYVPMRYDEAYTVVAFAIRPLWNAISDYHLPNNHIFHTLLVHFSLQWFGMNEAAARLPALLAGLLCIPTGYLAGKSLYNRWAGLLAAAWIGFSPIMVIFSTNARGYSLVCLFTLILVGLGNYLRQHTSLVAWCLLAIFTAFGFFTLPTMLYPAGIVYSWLALSWLFRDTGPGPRSQFFLFALFVSGLLAGLLSLFLYIPVLLTSGVDALIANRHVVSLSWYEFSGNLPLRALDTWRFWTTDWPSGLALLFGLGLLLSIVLHARIARYRIHLLVPTVLWLGFTLVIQKVAPLPRIWLFLLPLFQIFSAAGLIGGLDAIFKQRPDRQKNWIYAASILLLGAVLTLATVYSNPANQDELAGPVREAGQITGQVLAARQPGELVAANSPIQAPLRFYLLKAGASEDLFYNEHDPQPFDQLLVVLERGKNLDQELARLKLNELIDLDQRVTVAETGGLIAYRMPHLP